MPRRYKNRRAWDGHGGGGGRGNLRVAKTPPLQSAFAGMPLRVALRSRCCHCRRLHARAMPPMENHVFITEAEWEGRVPSLLPRPLLEYCGLQPILPFLGGRSDAACRVVLKTVSLHGWKVRRAWDGYGGGVGGQLSVPPLPRYDSQSRQWVEMRFSAAKPHIRRSVFSVLHFSLPLRENCELCCCTGSAFGATVRCYG